MAPAPLEQIGPFVRHDDAATQPSNASHLLQGAFRVAEEIETTDAQHRVERAIREGKALALGQGKEQTAVNVPVAAGSQRPLSDVDATDVYAPWQQGDVLAVADADLQQRGPSLNPPPFWGGIKGGAQVSQDLHARTGQAAKRLEK